MGLCGWATAFLILAAAVGLASAINIQLLVGGGTRPTDLIHYEYHTYQLEDSRDAKSEALLDPTTRQPPPGKRHVLSNLTIDNAAENQVVREFVQPDWAWLPLTFRADGKAVWLTYDEATGTAVEKPATYINLLAGWPSGSGRLAIGGCAAQNGSWFRPSGVLGTEGNTVLKTRTRDRGSFKFGESYYNIEGRVQVFATTLVRANQREFLSYPGKVASIETAEENAFLASVLREMGISEAWIGGLRSSQRQGANESTWIWGSPVDGTRTSALFARFYGGDLCDGRGHPVISPGVFHSFPTTQAACGVNTAGLLLRDDGSWRVVDNPAQRYPTILEFPTRRNVSGDVQIRNKILRVVALDEDSMRARATAEQSRLAWIPGQPLLKGHLPIPETAAEAQLLNQMVAARTDRCVPSQRLRSGSRVHLGFELDNATLNFKATHGLRQGDTVGYTSANLFLSAQLLNLPVGPSTPCLSIEGPAYRLGDCGLNLGMTIAEFDLNAVGNRYYGELGLLVTQYGLQQLAGTRVGRYIGHVPTVRTEAQLQVLGRLAFLNGRERGVNSFNTKPGPFFWFDGSPAGSGLSAQPSPSGLGTRCLSLAATNLTAFQWRSSGCKTVFTPALLEFSEDPVLPEEMGRLSACDVCKCTPPVLECLGTGLARLPKVPNASSFTSGVFSANDIPRLTRSELQPFQGMTDMSVFASGVTSVEVDAFASLPQLRSLDFTLNDLTALPHLRNTNLIRLTLTDNAIASISAGLLPTSLIELNLRGNFLSSIPAGSLDSLVNLANLNLRNNHIGALHKTTFVFLGPLLQVSLDGNPCDCQVSGGVITSCAAGCVIEGTTTTTAATSPPPEQPTSGNSSGRGADGAVVVGAALAVVVAVILLCLVALVLWRRRAARSTKVQVDPRGAWSGDASSSALCAGDMSSFAVAEEEAVTALMGARISQDSLELGQPLGSGAFGEVFRGRGRSGRIAGMEVAVKTLATTERDARDVFMKEASLQLELQHPHIVTLLGVCMNPGRGPMIVMELMPRGDLRQHLVKETASGRAPETAALTSWCEQVCSAMAYLETKRILHRDIAARNVLLSGELVAKLADLGLARTLSGKDYYRKLSDDRVPLKWMAPESIVDKVYVIRSDVWSFGVLLFETFSLGGKPYPNMTAAETVKFVLGGNRLPAPFGMPEEIARLMQHCWQHEPYARPSFAELHASLQSTLASNEEESVL